MKRIFKAAGLLALAAFLVAPVSGDSVVTAVKTYTLAFGWDLDGEGADADQVIAASVIVDDGTSVGGADWTIAAQPDTCRLLDLTIVDTDLSAGTITVTGTDCWDETLVATFAFTAGDDTGTATLTVDRATYPASGAYFKTVTTVTTGTMTGESDETFALGYAGDATPAQYALYGVARKLPKARDFEDLLPSRAVDLDGFHPVNLLVTTTDAWSTTLTSVNTDGPFTNVAVNDLLYFNLGGVMEVRKVTARASADSITLSSGIVIPSEGVTFKYKDFFVLADPIDGWFTVKGWDAATAFLDVDANTDTGGVVSDFSCATDEILREPLVQVDTDTVASAATGTAVSAIDLRLAPYAICRFGMEFGTNDDDDTGAEDINISIAFRR